MLLFLSCATTSAQEVIPNSAPNYNKPKLFNSLPGKIAVEIKELDLIFSQSAKFTRDATARFTSKNLSSFNGKISSAMSKYDNRIRSLVIHPSIFSGATFTLSSSTKSDGTIEYSGRIVNFAYGDAYQLKKQNDQYFLIKKNLYELVNEW